MVTLTIMIVSFSEAFISINYSRPASPSIWKRDYPNYHQFQNLHERDTTASKSRTSHRSNSNTRRSTFLMYEPSSNDPRKEANDALKSGFWNALEYTEQWITETLRKATEEGKTNPYARKELNYFCEMNEYTIAAVASIFRYGRFFHNECVIFIHLLIEVFILTMVSLSNFKTYRRFREAREIGERHSYAEEHVARVGKCTPLSFFCPWILR
jgi:hypothetical protein